MLKERLEFSNPSSHFPVALTSALVQVGEVGAYKTVQVLLCPLGSQHVLPAPNPAKGIYLHADG